MSVTLSSLIRSPASPVPSAREPAPRSAEPAAGNPAATDKVTLGANAAPDLTYPDPRSAATGNSELNAMLEESDRQTRQVLDLLLPLLQQQGLNIGKVISGEQTLSADPETIAKAQAAIADDGEYGVKQVSERILNFAQAAIGGDPSKLSAVRAAVEKGFAEATKILGGSLPDISQKTYDAVMAGFDSWAKQDTEAQAA